MKTTERRNAIRAIAQQFKNQPLQAHVIVRRLSEKGIKTTEKTVQRDFHAIIDAQPAAYHLQRTALVLGA